MDKKSLQKLPEEMATVIVTTAEKNYDNNLDKFKDMPEKQIYMVAYLQGYEAAWSIYTDDDEDVLEKYDNNHKNIFQDKTFAKHEGHLNFYALLK